jgi:hypothetical protein
MTVTTYNLKAGNGKHIRKATKVVFSNGVEVAFTERMTQKAAIEQAKRYLATEAIREEQYTIGKYRIALREAVGA